MKRLFPIFPLLAVLLAAGCGQQTPIDRKALAERNSPVVARIDSLASLSVGNGEFAFTVDATGLQSFPEFYSKGVPLGTQSQWGWHSFANPEQYAHDETLRDYDFGRGRTEPYSVQFNEPGRSKRAADWYRVNPHRLHLGIIGFDGLAPSEVESIRQRLDLWQGRIVSRFSAKGADTEVTTVCHPHRDMIAADIRSAAMLPVVIRFPYPTGGHCDDACDWSRDDAHSSELVEQSEGHALIRRTLDGTVYYVVLDFEGAQLSQTGRNRFLLTPTAVHYSLRSGFYATAPADSQPGTDAAIAAAADYWRSYWSDGAAVDFSRCTDPRAAELERRTVLSQYLLGIQCAGSCPPQETGLTYNSWFGKFHLEMIWWHQAQFALWGRRQLLARTLDWYPSVEPVAREIARRQGFEGLRWMKMTDPSGTEAPSKVGSFLIWQQPHYIYLAELVYRADPSEETLKKYYELVQKTAQFMVSFAEYDGLGNRYILRGAIPAQETLRAAETVNPPFELSYWHFALSTAQKWRERMGEGRNLQWDEVIDKLSPLAAKEGLYLAAETAEDTYKDIRFTSDHMAVLGALGVLPQCPLVRKDFMHNTFDWIFDHWNWGRTWGWDYPMTAMNAVRLGEPRKAVDALLMDKRTNTYLVNGHNYQDTRLRCYLPGNGGLLTAVALMCAGWDGCRTKNPGFPDDGTWDVRWEGLQPMP
ncbi:MAG: hypothetical protein K2I62_06540 [Alistipes sp.]|nr:hypothetical protein [Alistipes sp.]